VISVLVAVLGLIPILGTIISAVVGCFLILVAAPEKIWVFLVFFIVLQRIEGDILYPKIVGKAVGLSELWVLVAVTVGGSVAGIMGMVMSVPVCSVAYILISEKVEQSLNEKNMSDID
jgi:predicted PurR-regulated permease PerM